MSKPASLFGLTAAALALVSCSNEPKAPPIVASEPSPQHEIVIDPNAGKTLAQPRPETRLFASDNAQVTESLPSQDQLPLPQLRPISKSTEIPHSETTKEIIYPTLSPEQLDPNAATSKVTRRAIVISNSQDQPSAEIRRLFNRLLTYLGQATITHHDQEVYKGHIRNDIFEFTVDSKYLAWLQQALTENGIKHFNFHTLEEAQDLYKDYGWTWNTTTP